MAKSSDNQKKTIVDNLLESVKQCQIRFGGRSELATDFDPRVVRLCEALEQALSHGLRNDKKLILYNRKMAVNGITNGSIGDTHETSVCFWHFVSLHLTRHEFDRYLLLKNVRTDIGRGKAWLRSALNEHSLERYMLTLLSYSFTLRHQFYEKSALIRDEDINSILPTISRGLNSILFAINIDNPEFDVFPIRSKSIDTTSRTEPLPVICKSSSNETSVGARRRRTRINVVSLSDDDERTEDLIGARSAPTTCLSSPDSLFQNKQFDTNCGMNKTNNNQKLYGFSSESVERNVVLTPLGNESQTQLELIVEDNVSDSDKASQAESHDLKFESSQDSNPDKDELDRMKAEMQCSRSKYEEKISKLESQLNSLQKENDLLKVQLNKYIAAVQLLKYSNKETNSAEDSNDSLRSLNEESISQKLVEMQNESYFDELNQYEKKLVEVAEMHAELVEFNGHLHRVIRQKDALIARLKEELIDLRGPLPEATEATEDLTSIASDFETDLSIQSSISHPLIHIWIPTVFLSSHQKSKSHHLYQIFVRIRDNKWNVYRRYSQFHSLHKSLKKKFRVLNSYDFPPKKTIGYKDSKVVQERRKKLEHYLRNLINLLQSQHSISDKQRLVAILPFLSERFVQSDGRSRSDTHLNESPEQHYMGL